MAIRRPPFPQNPQDIPQPVAPVFPPEQIMPRPSIGMVHRPRKDLLQWSRRKKGGIGGLLGKLRRKILEGRQFPRGIPEQFRQLPFGPPSMGRILPNFGMKQKPMAPWDPPQGWRGETVMPMPMQPLPEEMPMPSLTPEEITQQRIDQVSQFEQEPMMRAQYGPLGGYAGGGIADLISYYGR